MNIYRKPLSLSSVRKGEAYFFTTTLMVLLTVLHANGQEFFTGTVNTTSTISRMGSVTLGYALFRNSSTGVQVLEHTQPVGDFYIRSVAYQVADDEGNLILNDLGGNVGVGTSKPKEKLSVNGKIRAQEVKVETANWPDYVFAAGYQLPSLQEIDNFINTYGHLPEVPSATEIAEKGLALGEMNALLLKKIEELTLHLIEKDKQVSQQADEITALQQDVVAIKKLLDNK